MPREDRPSNAPSSLPPSGGKEELRASFLRPYLVRLREQLGPGDVRTLLLAAGLPTGLLDDESTWLSIGSARRMLAAIARVLGEEGIAHRGEWMTHPETLGTYVRLLRTALTPLGAYRYLTEHAAETTRAGRFELDHPRSDSASIVYFPHTEMSADQGDPLLCSVRAAELRGVPRLWGLPDAELEHPECLARGGDCCRYELKWRMPTRRSIPITALASSVVCGGSVAISGSISGAVAGVLVGGTLGAALGMTWERLARERATRIFERHRIAALERGLELRGQGAAPQGEIAGSVLGGKYRILRRIGSGGIGAVYAAEHIGLGSRLAVKLLRGAAAADPAEAARLRREARVQVSIEHPNVVRTLDLDQLPDGSIYVVMELLDGASLADKLRDEHFVAPGVAVPVFTQVCHALDAAHRLGVVHRDLKPGNVFITLDGTVKVLDFGMSKFAEAEALTQDGYTLGTPEYMAPEQCIGADVQPRSDIYAFGVMMYEALTGTYPITAPDRQQLLDLHQRHVPDSMNDARPDLPISERLDHAVMRCLSKRPEHRPHAAELARLLESIPDSELAGSYPPPPPGVARHTAHSSSSSNHRAH